MMTLLNTSVLETRPNSTNACFSGGSLLSPRIAKSNTAMALVCVFKRISGTEWACWARSIAITRLRRILPSAHLLTSDIGTHGRCECVRTCVHAFSRHSAKSSHYDVIMTSSHFLLQQQAQQNGAAGVTLSQRHIARLCCSSGRPVCYRDLTKK